MANIKGLSDSKKDDDEKKKKFYVGGDLQLVYVCG